RGLHVYWNWWGPYLRYVAAAMDMYWLAHREQIRLARSPNWNDDFAVLDKALLQNGDTTELTYVDGRPSPEPRTPGDHALKTLQLLNREWTHCEANGAPIAT